LRAFIDTGFFCALANRGDAGNTAANQVIKELTESGAAFCTSDYVLSETYTLIMIRTAHRLAAEFMKRFPQSKIEIIRITEEIEDKAKGIFLKYSDKRFSFVDCTSFALIEKFKIEKVLTFDHHFREYRFSHPVDILPRR
jgi:predicted nucleic acid-binding protein